MVHPSLGSFPVISFTVVGSNVVKTSLFSFHLLLYAWGRPVHVHHVHVTLPMLKGLSSYTLHMSSATHIGVSEIQYHNYLFHATQVLRSWWKSSVEDHNQSSDLQYCKVCYWFRQTWACFPCACFPPPALCWFSLCLHSNNNQGQRHYVYGLSVRLYVRPSVRLSVSHS